MITSNIFYNLIRHIYQYVITKEEIEDREFRWIEQLEIAFQNSASDNGMEVFTNINILTLFVFRFIIRKIGILGSWILLCNFQSK